MNEQFERQVNDFYLVFQPIIRVLSDEKVERTHFEILLRSKESQVFPGELVDFFTAGEERNRLFLDWYEGQLIDLCERYPDYTFYLNTHPHQLKYLSTWDFLEKLKAYARQIQIEITEKPVNFDRVDIVDEAQTYEFFRRVKDMGFQLNFDDVGTGQNSLEFIAKHIDLISTLKFSIRAFEPLDEAAVLKFLYSWKHVADSNNLNFIVEGIETKELAQSLYNTGIEWQQGFYWDRTISL